jgi:hypothetical protein
VSWTIHPSLFSSAFHSRVEFVTHNLLEQFFPTQSKTSSNLTMASGFGGLVVSALASGTQVQTRPKPSEFTGKKILSAPSFGGEVQSRRSHVSAFRHVKNPYNYRGSSNCKLNSLGHFSPIVLPFSARGFSRHLCAERAGRRQVRPKAWWCNQPIGCSAHGWETHRPYSKGRRRTWQWLLIE